MPKAAPGTDRAVVGYPVVRATILVIQNARLATGSGMSKRRLFGGLRGRLAGLVLLAVLPGFLVGALNAVSMMTQAQKAARASLMSALERITRVSETEVEHAVSDMIAATGEMPGGALGCSDALVAFAQHNPRYLDVGLADSDGHIVCDLPRPGMARTPVDRKLVQLALRTPGKPTSALISVPGSQLPRLVVFHALPIVGAAHRVAYTSLEFSRAFKLASDPIAREARVVVIDTEGHGSELKTPAGHHLKPLSARELSSLDVESRLAPAAGPSIIRAGASLIGMIPLGTAGGPDGIMLDIAREDLYRGAWLELSFSITVMMFALLFILLLLLWVSERLIMQPALLLTHAADRLALGDLETRTGLPPGNDEFSRVAMAFDRMAESIQQRTDENNLHLRTLRRTGQLQSVLANLNAAIFHRESPAQLLDTLCESVCETGGFHMAWVGEADTETGLLKPVSWAGPGSALLAGLVVSLDDSVAEGQGPAAATARTDAVSVSNRFIEDPSTAAWHALGRQLGIGAALALPMGVTLQGHRRVLTVYAHEPDYFAVDEIQLIEQVAHDAAFGLHLIATEQALAHTSTHDSITGLPNHLLLKERLGDAVRRATVRQTKVVVSVVDVGFQQVTKKNISKRTFTL